jgi:hypothetical protein
MLKSFPSVLEAREIPFQDLHLVCSKQRAYHNEVRIRNLQTRHFFFESVRFFSSLRKALRKLLILDRTDSFVGVLYCLLWSSNWSRAFPLISLYEYDLSFTFHKQLSTLYTLINPEMNSALWNLDNIVSKYGQFEPQLCGLNADFCLGKKISVRRLSAGRRVPLRTHTHTHSSVPRKDKWRLGF